MSRNKAHVPHLFLPIALLAGLFSCSTKHLTRPIYAYGTNWMVHLYEGEESLLDEIESYVLKTSRILDLNASKEAHGVYALNHLDKVEADPFLLEAFELADAMEKEFPDCYSYRIGDLTSSWQDALSQKKVLDDERVEELLQKAKDTSVRRDGTYLCKTGEGSVDFGSLGKGLCLRHIEKMLKDKSIKGYLIDAGSSSWLFGENPEGDHDVKVNLKDAKGRYFYAKNCSISNSSISEHAVTLGGVTYSHIIDPRNGKAISPYDAVVAKGRDAAYADALTTALMIAGEDYASFAEKKGYLVAFMKGGEVAYATPSFLN
ncbi:MAG: FAD:protein FMN transferase [Bacilli bacterium]|nr:FAD:protein FMN transferase [Bacilli bacterium]